MIPKTPEAVKRSSKTAELLSSAGCFGEKCAPARGHNQPALLHGLVWLKTHQSVADRVLPDRQMRAAAPPRFGVGIAARRFCHPGEKLLRQCRRRFVHRQPKVIP